MLVNYHPPFPLVFLVAHPNKAHQWFFLGTGSPVERNGEVCLCSQYQPSPKYLLYLDLYMKLFSSAPCPEKDYAQALVWAIEGHVATINHPLGVT